jgi:hypothetical protein
MTIDARLELALRSANRVAELRNLARQLLDDGTEREKLMGLLEQKRQRLRTDSREEEEDAIMDVMDFVSGWCSPHMRLQ